MILVLGQGLLGSHLCALYPRDTIGVSHRTVDITNWRAVESLLDSAMPDAVINCAGIVRKRRATPEQLKAVNSDAPHRLADLCGDRGIRLIQISTDCVFSGKDGKYSETDSPDPVDAYGESKLAGEVIDQEPHLTVRCSFVGWPDPTGRGLLAWLASHKAGDIVPGYSKVAWNGLTTVVLADYLSELAYRPQIWGLRHLFAETISKYDILRRACHVYGWKYTIQPVNAPALDMTLSTVHTDMPWLPGTWNAYETFQRMADMEATLAAPH